MKADITYSKYIKMKGVNIIMNELKNKIDQLLFIIEQLTNGIVKENYRQENEFTFLLNESLLSTVPDIIKIYLEQNMLNHQHDMLYWTDTVRQILEAIERKDKFNLVDLLHFEFKENLITFRNTFCSQ